MRHSGEILMLGMFDLARLDRARAVRIHHLHLALQERGAVKLLSGARTSRRRAVLHWLLQNRLRHTRAVYVEASTSTAIETDLCLLALARAKHIPVLVYVPDAQQLFPAIFPRVGWRVRLLDWGWRRSIAAYLRLADVLLFPSQGLANCFDTRQPTEMLPPAGLPNRECVPLAWEPPVVVYVGGASQRYGSDLLLDAMKQVVAQHPTTRCHFVTGDVDAEVLASHPARYEPWLTVERRAFQELPAILSTATATVLPMRINPYNDLAVPVKLFDYMSFGRPVVATGCRDTAALVNELEAGLIVDDTANGIAQGIMRLLEDPGLASRLGQNGYQAIQTAHAWPHRAAQLLQIIEALEQGQGVK